MSALRRRLQGDQELEAAPEVVRQRGARSISPDGDDGDEAKADDDVEANDEGNVEANDDGKANDEGNVEASDDGYVEADNNGYVGDDDEANGAALEGKEGSR